MRTKSAPGRPRASRHPSHTLEARTIAWRIAEAGSPATRAVAPLEQVDSVLAHALDQLLAAGLSTQRASELASTRIVIADLEGNTLASAGNDTIFLDASAAGWGWFVDKSPHDDSEFAFTDRLDALYATSGSKAYQRVDLLTVLNHELAHLLGAEHHDATGHLLSAELGLSSRHRLDADAVDHLFESIR